MTTYPNDVVEKALAAQHLVLDRGGSGADALRAALAAAEAAMWRPIDEHDGGVTPWLVEDGDGFVGEASYLPDYKGWWWIDNHPTDYVDRQVKNPRRFRAVPTPPTAVSRSRPARSKLAAHAKLESTRRSCAEATVSRCEDHASVWKRQPVQITPQHRP
jgi:hypothetical protein